MTRILCEICFLNSLGNCNNGCEHYMHTEECEAFVEIEDVGPLEEDLGNDYLDDGVL